MSIVGPFQCQDKWCSLVLLWPQIWLFYVFYHRKQRLAMDGLAFCKSMLIAPNYLIFQADKICFKGTCSMVFQEPEVKMTSFSLDFGNCFKDGCNICLFPGTCNLPEFPWLPGSVISLQRLSQSSDVLHRVSWARMGQVVSRNSWLKPYPLLADALLEPFH